MQHYKKGLLAANYGTLIYKCASVHEDTIKKLSTYLFALLCYYIHRKFGTNIQKITMTPGNTTVSHIAAPKVFMSHDCHTATCPSAATYPAKVTVNSLGLAPGLLHSNAKLQHILIACSPEPLRTPTMSTKTSILLFYAKYSQEVQYKFYYATLVFHTYTKLIVLL